MFWKTFLVLTPATMLYGTPWAPWLLRQAISQIARKKMRKRNKHPIKALHVSSIKITVPEIYTARGIHNDVNLFVHIKVLVD